MEWFKLIMTIFYAVNISINIAGIYASIKSIRKYKDYQYFQYLREKENFLKYLENQRKQG